MVLPKPVLFTSFAHILGFLSLFDKKWNNRQPFLMATFCHQKRFLMAKGCQQKRLTLEKASVATSCHWKPFPMVKVAIGKGYQWPWTTFAVGNLFWWQKVAIRKGWGLFHFLSKSDKKPKICTVPSKSIIFGNTIDYVTNFLGRWRVKEWTKRVKC